jgi:hypothetical protein
MEEDYMTMLCVLPVALLELEETDISRRFSFKLFRVYKDWGSFIITSEG